MFNQNKKLIAPQEYFHFSNRFAQEKLIAHSGFVTSAESGVRQSDNAQMLFSDWFWQGGFLILISYLVIIAGTCVFIKHLFSLIREKKIKL